MQESPVSQRRAVRSASSAQEASQRATVSSGRGLARLRSVEVQESLLTTLLEWVQERFQPEQEARRVADHALSAEATVAPRAVR